jgi:eukaryotic-like serine/threonine-protein kinase
LRDLGSSDNDTVAPSELPNVLPTTPAASASAAPTDTAEPAPTTSAPSPSPSASVPVEVGSIRAIDPQGDGDEDTASSPLAVDGKDSTAWTSQTYNSASFGSLKKGVGLSLKLKKSAALTSATIEVRGTGGTVEVRTGSSPDVSASTLVGKGSIKNGQVTVKAKNAKPAKYVILWFTKLPSVGGNYKLEVSEVRLK